MSKFLLTLIAIYVYFWTFGFGWGLAFAGFWLLVALAEGEK